MEAQDVERVLESDGEEANFSDLFVGDEGCRAVAEALSRSNVRKTRVVMRGNYLSADGAAMIAEVLKMSHIITYLSLEWNTIGTFDHGVDALANALEVNQSLTSLDLRNNNISERGGKALARALRTNSVLKTLDLRWNEIGSEGARAFRDMLNVNSTVTDLKLSGNKVDEALLENIEAAVKDRDTQLVEHVALRDDLHVARERADQLEARLRRQVREEEELRKKEQQMEGHWQLELAAKQEDMVKLKMECDRELEASAQQVALLEEEIIQERSKVSMLTDSLKQSQEKGKDTADELERIKQVSAETKRDLQRQVEKLTLAIEAANEDRRTTQRELEHTRDMLEKELEEVKEEHRKLSVENDALHRAGRRTTATLEQTQSSLETTEAEVRMLKDRIDEHVSMVSKATADSKLQVEETRRMYEERIEAIKRDCESRVRAAEDRAKETEYERQRSEASRQAAHKELTRVQITMEERLAENERRINADAQKKFDLELTELRERVEAVQKSRDLHAAALKDQMASMESLRSKSAADAREYGNELAKYKADLESIHDTARLHEGRCSKLQTELGVALRKAETAQNRIESLERDKHHTSEVHSSNMEKVTAQHHAEVKALEKLLTDVKAAAAATEDELNAKAEDLVAMRQGHLHSLNGIERQVTQNIAEVFGSARQRETSSK